MPRRNIPDSRDRPGRPGPRHSRRHGDARGGSTGLSRSRGEPIDESRMGSDAQEASRATEPASLPAISGLGQVIELPVPRGPVSPELALVDPVLERLARARLHEPGAFQPAVRTGAAWVGQARPGVATDARSSALGPSSPRTGAGPADAAELSTRAEALTGADGAQTAPRRPRSGLGASHDGLHRGNGRLDAPHGATDPEPDRAGPWDRRPRLNGWIDNPELEAGLLPAPCSVSRCSCGRPRETEGQSCRCVPAFPRSEPAGEPHVRLAARARRPRLRGADVPGVPACPRREDASTEADPGLHVAL